MSATSFLVALAALSLGTYAMRLAGVKVGAAVATRGRRAVKPAESTPAAGSGAVTAAEPTPGAAKWMDRATVVLIAAVCATTAIFDGKELADPARLIGVGVGVAAAILRVPMLICVIAGMVVCAIIRTTGLL
ncbi:AzlD domain-containing protein [Brevibacterium sp.]|uniref:AzlD domain-containing protein n=1 Tax=Brevibacterium sp. TaxID=1701 RepID=UPI0028115FCB|nr:AzlD domain-containing protein [Brevibacterium sp.]